MNRMVFVAYVCIAFGCRCMPAYVIRISTPRYTPGPDRSIKRTILLQAKLDGNNGFCEARQIRNGHRWAPWRFFPSKPYVSKGLQFQTVSFGGAHSGHREEAGNLLAREGKTAGMMYPSKLEATEAYNHLNY